MTKEVRRSLEESALPDHHSWDSFTYVQASQLLKPLKALETQPVNPAATP